MTYVRISIARPRRGEEQRLEEVMRRLATFAGQQPGCLQSYVLKPNDGSGEIARLAIYENEEAAEQAASSQTVMALRSEMHLVCEPGHTERAFFTV